MKFSFVNKKLGIIGCSEWNPISDSFLFCVSFLLSTALFVGHLVRCYLIYLSYMVACCGGWGWFKPDIRDHQMRTFASLVSPSAADSCTPQHCHPDHPAAALPFNTVLRRSAWDMGQGACYMVRGGRWYKSTYGSWFAGIR